MTRTASWILASLTAVLLLGCAEELQETQGPVLIRTATGKVLSSDCVREKGVSADCEITAENTTTQKRGLYRDWRPYGPRIGYYYYDIPYYPQNNFCAYHKLPGNCYGYFGYTQPTYIPPRYANCGQCYYNKWGSYCVNNCYVRAYFP